MSNLVLELKPGETMLINGAAIRFRTRTRLELVSRARFLFGKQIMETEDASSPATRLYHALQMAYVGPEEQRTEAIETALALVAEREAAGPDNQAGAMLGAIRDAMSSGEFYGALKLARSLVAAERLTGVLPNRPMNIPASISRAACRGRRSA